MKELACYQVWIEGSDFYDDYKWTTNAKSRGQAKSEFIRMLDGCCGNVQWTAVRARKVGGPRTSEQFRRTAAYRGLPDLVCGQRVTVGEAKGIIVGHNASANFDVLFDEDSPKYAGLRLNVHPSELSPTETEEKR